MQKLFEPKTGFLPLSLVGHVDCEDPFLPKGVIPQIYAMFANELCPPVGYTSSFEGQFIVSKPRIMKNSWWTYQRLLVGLFVLSCLHFLRFLKFTPRGCSLTQYRQENQPGNRNQVCFLEQVQKQSTKN